MRDSRGEALVPIGNAPVWHGSGGAFTGYVECTEGSSIVGNNDSAVSVYNNSFLTPLRLTNTDFTVEFWMLGEGYISLGIPDGDIYLALYNQKKCQQYLCFLASSGTLQASFNSTATFPSHSYSSWGYSKSISYTAPSTWTHYAVVRSGVKVYFFAGGVLKITLTLASASDVLQLYDDGFSLGNGRVNTTVGFAELRISSGARYTANFTPPTAPFAANERRLAVDSSDNVYGYDSTNTTFGQVATGWSGMTPAQQLAVAQTCGDGFPTTTDLATISGKYKPVTVLVDDFNPTTTIKAVPKAQLVTPAKLISSKHIEGINSCTLTASTANNGVVKTAITFDGSNYYIYGDGTKTSTYTDPSGNVGTTNWIPVTCDITNLNQYGMTSTDLAALTRTEWDELFYLVGDHNKIGFAYLLDISDADTDTAIVDDLSLNVDISGIWTKATQGTDYTYSYPSTTTLKVTILVDGSYRINYPV